MHANCNSLQRGCKSPYSTCNNPHVAFAAFLEYATTHTAPVTSNVMAVTAEKEDAIAHIALVQHTDRLK